MPKPRAWNHIGMTPKITCGADFFENSCHEQTLSYSYPTPKSAQTMDAQ